MSDFKRIDTREALKMPMKSERKFRKKVREKSGNSVSKIWQTPDDHSNVGQTRVR